MSEVANNENSSLLGRSEVAKVDLMRNAVELIAAKVPGSWRCELMSPGPIGSMADGVIELTRETQRAYLVVEARSLVNRRDVPDLVERLTQRGEAMKQHGHPVPFVAARYLSSSVQDSLADRGISYADTTGNLRVLIERPDLFLRDVGAGRDPGRGPGRPLGTLKGLPAARIVRALADYAPPMTMRQLAERSTASIGATYRVVEFLDREALVERDAKGSVVACDWPALLRRWSEDYAFSDNAVSRFVAPRGISTLLKVIPPLVGRYAVTGSPAAARYAAYAPLRLAMVYAEEPVLMAQSWGLTSADTGANVLIARAPAELPWIRSGAPQDGITYVAPSQAVVDLLRAPGRGPEEAEQLIHWMEQHPDAWRH